MNKTDKFLNNIYNLFDEDLPEHVFDKAKYSLLDYIGVTFAGTTALHDKLEKYLQDFEFGYSTAVGLDCKLCIKDAVFLNGLNGHALDFDDGTNAGIIHLGSPIFAALLPLAEKYEISYEHFLKAAVIGYETSFTMAVSIQPEHKEMGYHATGTCGVLGVAIAVSYLLDYNKQETKNAFATACVSATGMLQVLDDGSELKPYNAAKAALLGLISAQMAKAGFRGNPDPLGNYRGYLKIFTGNADTKLKQPLLDGTYAIEKTYTKPYAACRYCHPSIEAAVYLKEHYNIKIESIKSILVETYDLAVNGHDHKEIKSAASAKMSIPYSVAVGLIYGQAGFREFDEKIIHNKTIVNLAFKVNVVKNDEYSKGFPKFTSSAVTVQMNDGTEYKKQIDFPKGEPENPLTEQEFTDRFIQLVTYGGKSEDEAFAIFNTVLRLNGDMKELFKYLT